MKTITVRQPWAYLLCDGIKDVENRTWRLPEKYKGEKILIHASAKSEDLAYLTEMQWVSIPEYYKKKLERYMIGGISAIIGHVIFSDCVQNSSSIWAEKGCYHWIVQEAKLFNTPLQNVKGKLSFWEFNNEIIEKEI